MPERLHADLLTRAIARLVGVDLPADPDDLGAFLEPFDEFGSDDPTELVLDGEG